MKKAIFLALFGILFAFAASAQVQGPFTANGTKAGTPYSIVTNAATTTITSPAVSTNGFEGLVTVMAYLSTASGTPAANVLIQGSSDGVHFNNIPTFAASYPAVNDTFKYTSSTISYHWRLNPLHYKYLQVVAYPSGTQSDTLRATYSIYYKR